MDVFPCLLRSIHTRASLAHPSVTSQNPDQCSGTFPVACGVSLLVAFSLLPKSFLQRLENIQGRLSLSKSCQHDSATSHLSGSNSPFDRSTPRPIASTSVYVASLTPPRLRRLVFGMSVPSPLVLCRETTCGDEKSAGTVSTGFKFVGEGQACWGTALLEVQSAYGVCPRSW